VGSTIRLAKGNVQARAIRLENGPVNVPQGRVVHPILLRRQMLPVWKAPANYHIAWTPRHCPT